LKGAAMNNISFAHFENSDTVKMASCHVNDIGDSFVEDYLKTPKFVEARKLFINKPPIKIHNIPFSIVEENGEFVVSNNVWPSLIASANSVHQAIENASQLITDVIDEYVFESEENLSADAIEFRKYLLTRIFS
jgi:predicted RNase H-like HicB family nuclease